MSDRAVGQAGADILNGQCKGMHAEILGHRIAMRWVYSPLEDQIYATAELIREDGRRLAQVFQMPIYDFPAHEPEIARGTLKAAAYSLVRGLILWGTRV